MDKISREDYAKLVEDWNRLSVTQSMATTTPTTTNFTGQFGPFSVQTFTYKQYDAVDFFIFMYNRLIDKINELESKISS